MEHCEHVMPVEHASSLTRWYRRLLQNPARMLNGQVRDGMVVLELGCGPGYFTPEIARRVGKSGKVIAADLQEGMLEIVRNKIRGTDIESRVELHKCEDDSIGVKEKVDLVVAFFVVHELPDKEKALKELKSILKPGGKVYINEFLMHPPKDKFGEMVDVARSLGFVEVERHRFLISRAIILK
jgi:ubiquinone/menaquinone biosynthesis C-methylase UbiE